jgi:hypothetical protein
VRIAAICLASCLLFAAAAPPAHAECEKLRSHLDREARRARRWDLAWALTFGTFAVAQGGMLAAEWVPGQEWNDDAAAGLKVGIVKSSIASLSHIVLRLKVERPSADDCASLARAVRETARHEKQAFYLNHVGSLLLNVGGLLWLGLVEDAWPEGWKSIALGYPIGLISTYTQPRASWHFAARLDDDGALVMLSGRF